VRVVSLTSGPLSARSPLLLRLPVFAARSRTPARNYKPSHCMICMMRLIRFLVISAGKGRGCGDFVRAFSNIALPPMPGRGRSGHGAAELSQVGRRAAVQDASEKRTRPPVRSNRSTVACCRHDARRTALRVHRSRSSYVGNGMLQTPLWEINPPTDAVQNINRTIPR